MVRQVAHVVLLGDGRLALRGANALVSHEAMGIADSAPKLDRLAHHDRHRLQRGQRRPKRGQNLGPADHVEQRSRVQPILLPGSMSFAYERLAHLVTKLSTPVDHRDCALDA